MSTANRVRLVRAVLLVTARVRPEHAKVPALNVRISVSAETRQRAQRSKHVASPHAKRQAATETSSHRTEDQILVPTTHPALRGLTGRQHCSPRVCDTAHAGSDSRPRKGGLPSTQERCGPATKTDFPKSRSQKSASSAAGAGRSATTKKVSTLTQNQEKCH